MPAFGTACPFGPCFVLTSSSDFDTRHMVPLTIVRFCEEKLYRGYLGRGPVQKP